MVVTSPMPWSDYHEELHRPDPTRDNSLLVLWQSGTASEKPHVGCFQSGPPAAAPGADTFRTMATGHQLQVPRNATSKVAWAGASDGPWQEEPASVADASPPSSSADVDTSTPKTSSPSQLSLLFTRLAWLRCLLGRPHQIQT